MRRGEKALMISNLALLLVVFSSDDAASMAVKGLTSTETTGFIRAGGKGGGGG